MVELGVEIVVVKGIGGGFVYGFRHLQSLVRPLILQMAPGQVNGGGRIGGISRQSGLILADQHAVPGAQQLRQPLHGHGIIAAFMHDLKNALLGIDQVSPARQGIGKSFLRINVQRVTLQNHIQDRFGFSIPLHGNTGHGIAGLHVVQVGVAFRQCAESIQRLLLPALDEVQVQAHTHAEGMLLGQSLHPVENGPPLLRNSPNALIIEPAVIIAALGIQSGLEILIGQGLVHANAAQNALLHKVPG